MVCIISIAVVTVCHHIKVFPGLRSFIVNAVRLPNKANRLRCRHSELASFGICFPPHIRIGEVSHHRRVKNKCCYLTCFAICFCTAFWASIGQSTCVNMTRLATTACIRYTQSNSITQNLTKQCPKVCHCTAAAQQLPAGCLNNTSSDKSVFQLCKRSMVQAYQLSRLQ